jgi:hypothetical protein
MIVRLLTGAGIGAGVGAVTGYVARCASGACPLTTNPYRDALYGAFQHSGYSSGSVFRAGKEVHRLIGLRRQEDYEDVIDSILKN